MAQNMYQNDEAFASFIVKYVNIFNFKLWCIEEFLRNSFYASH